MEKINHDTFNKKWHLQLLKLFPKSEYVIELNDWYSISIKNILESNIELNTKYGMFSLYFVSEKSKADFCIRMGLKIVDETKGNSKLVGAIWDGDKYKFRIYAHTHQLRIFFYPQEKFSVDDLEEKIRYYTESLEIVLESIIDNRKHLS